MVDTSTGIGKILKLNKEEWHLAAAQELDDLKKLLETEKKWDDECPKIWLEADDARVKLAQQAYLFQRRIDKLTAKLGKK